MLCDGLNPEAQSGSLPVDHYAEINVSDIQGAEAQRDCLDPKRLRQLAYDELPQAPRTESPLCWCGRPPIGIDVPL